MDYTLTAYLAGIVDGEGCVSLAFRQGKYVTPTVQITNTDQGFIEWLQEAVPGGSIYTMNEHRPRRKQVYMWRCAGAVAREFVRDVKPFLRIKDRQARLVLEMPVRKPGERMTEADFELNRKAVARMRVLNARGVAT